MASKFELSVKFVTKADTKGIDKTGVSIAALGKEAKVLEKEMGKVADELRKGNISADDAAKKYNKLEKKLDGVNDELVRTKRVAGGAKKSLAAIKTTALGVGAGILVAGAALAAFGKESLALFAVQEKAEAQLANVIKSTGSAAGVTAKEMREYASELQNMTTFGDEAIIGAQSLLLTFTNIGGPVLKEATATVLDMSQALGQDLESSSVQLGKALNDPILGITALSRVGVSFTDQQKETIETMVELGDVAGAQAVILAELNKEFGGSAAAQVETFDGQLTQLTNTYGDLQEEIGESIAAQGKFIPLLTKQLGILTTSTAMWNTLAQAQESGLFTEEQIKEAYNESDEALAELADRYLTYIDELETAVTATEEHDRALLGESTAVEHVERATVKLTEAEIEANEATLAIIVSGQRYADVGADMASISERAANKFEFLRQKAEAAKTTFEDYNTTISSSEPFIEDYIAATDTMIESQGEWVEVNRDNSAAIAEINEQLFSDLDSDQLKAARDAVANAEEGGAEWVAAFTTVQDDISESQRAALILRRAELEASQGDIASVYTGDIQAFEAAQEAKAEAARQLTQVISEEGFKQVEARLLASGEEGAIEQVIALQNLQVDLGLKTQAAADIAIQQAEAFGQSKEVVDALLDKFLEDSVLSQDESERLANAITMVGEGTELSTEQLITFGLLGAEGTEKVTTAFGLTDEAIIVATGSVDIIAEKLEALPDEVVVNIRINQTGAAIPGGIGSVANTAAATSTAAANSQNDRMGGT